MKYFLSSFLVLFTFLLEAQMPRDVFPFTREYKKGGLYFSPQATVSFGNKEEGTFNVGTDTSYQYETVGRGKWGYGLEVGWFHTFKNNLWVDFVEGAIAYRFFQGAAEHKGSLITNQQTLATVESDNSFKNQTAIATIRAIKAKQLGSHSFLTYGIGINYNYSFSQSFKREVSYPNQYEQFLDQSNLQAHVQVGYGLRLSKQLLMIPTLETPIVSVLPSDNLNPAFPFFSANYHPLIIGLKFMLIRKDPVNCNAPVLKSIPGN